MPIRSGSTIVALSALLPLLLVGRVLIVDEGRCEDVEKDETTTAAPPTSSAMDNADGNFIVYCKNYADVEYGLSNE